MSLPPDDRKVFSLSDVTRSIQNTLNARYTSSFWIKAEMNKLNHYPHSGHSYPELVEKKNGKIIAEMRSVLWRDDYVKINNRFLKVLNEPLKNGISILFCATICFDPVFGLSLRILDIDPAFSLGVLEREKAETIIKLKEEGVWDKNRSLLLALLPKRIAVISVETSKGYSDFRQVIDRNAWGYRISHVLFPAILQGDKSVGSILLQFKRIATTIKQFDAVAIIRGGGGDVGLTCYNDYTLAKEIAMFPIPVLTGIGHSTNQTVSEMVAFKNAITPTDLADFLIGKFHDFAGPLQDAEEALKRSVLLIKDHQRKLNNAVKYFRSVTANLLERNHEMINTQSSLLRQQCGYRFREGFRSVNDTGDILKRSFAVGILKQRNELLNIERIVNILDPVNQLKRGYTITVYNGKLVRSANEIKKGEVVNTIFADGTMSSKVTSTR